MDYNNNTQNIKFNYYPTFDIPLTTIHSNNLTSPNYNDNLLNPPSTLNDIIRQQNSRDSTKNTMLNNMDTDQLK
jgi:hypothetical protein